MDLASKIRQLCREVVACEDDAHCIDMLEELQSALHAFIDAMRENVIVFPMYKADSPMYKADSDVDEPDRAHRYSKRSHLA